MQTETAGGENTSETGSGNARWLLRGVQLLFLIIALRQLNAPFLTAHNERQNQTYDIARHVFQDGWSGVFTPKTSFSLPGYDARPYTIVRQEFPFHGLLGWPLVKWFGHERAVVRLISVVFALCSIEFIYLILQRWLNPASAVIGAALWGLSPLVLQFGQVPMPDILCTTGMLGAFWYALKPNLPASSAWFLFAILAKVSVIFFGLPILTMLLLARQCRSVSQFLKISLMWGIIPLIGLLGWTWLEIRDPDTPWTVIKLATSERGAGNLHSVKFFFFLAASLFPYGIGILGLAGCGWLMAAKKSLMAIKPVLAISVFIAIVLYLLVVVIKIPEPQYILPILAWLVLLMAFGLNYFLTGRPGVLRRVAITAAVGLHVLIALVFTADLKASRIPDFHDVETVAKLIPPDSRVITAYPFYGASPAVWLGHNVYTVHYTNELGADLPQFQKEGFDYILIMDVKSHSVAMDHPNRAKLTKAVAGLLHLSAETTDPTAGLTDFAAPDSPFRVYCDGRFKQLFSTRYVVLYSLIPPDDQRPEPQAR